MSLFHSSREWYESEAVMVSEEAQLMTGLLMGLNAIDYNMTLPGEECDRSVREGGGRREGGREGGREEREGGREGGEI